MAPKAPGLPKRCLFFLGGCPDNEDYGQVFWDMYFDHPISGNCHIATAGVPLLQVVVTHMSSRLNLCKRTVVRERS